MQTAPIVSITPIVYLAVCVLQIAALWKIFIKAGQPGWASIIPVYNLYVFLLVAGKPGWWLVLMFIPLVHIVIAILTSLGIADNFGKGAGFGVGLALLPFIFFPILAFGDAEIVLSRR